MLDPIEGKGSWSSARVPVVWAQILQSIRSLRSNPTSFGCIRQFLWSRSSTYFDHFGTRSTLHLVYSEEEFSLTWFKSIWIEVFYRKKSPSEVCGVQNSELEKILLVFLFFQLIVAWFLQHQCFSKTSRFLGIFVQRKLVLHQRNVYWRY